MGRTGIVAERMRSAYRLGNYPLSYVHSGVGFRLNGMNRGGYYSATYGVSRDVRSASRVDRRLSNVNPGIGFRTV